MCVAIYKPQKNKISRERLEEAFNANPDGCGLMWADGNLQIQKGCWNFDKFYSLYSTLEHSTDSDIVIHFRTASSGNINDAACHPFFVDKNLAFVENGNLFEFSNFFAEWKDDKTDIQRFNAHILQRLPADFLALPDARKALEEYCRANFTKMIFMDKAGKVDIINEPAGEWVLGSWYSNGGIKNYIGYGYSGAYFYNATDVRHKGGRVNERLFPEKRRKNWKKCNECKGYFYKMKNDVCLDCAVFKNLSKYCGIDSLNIMRE